MARKPDVFEQMVEKIECDGWSGDAFAVARADAVKLLRRYHARVRKMVENIDAVMDSAYNHGRYDTREELLEKLDQLKKGGR